MTRRSEAARLRDRILDKARALGFDALGITAPDTISRAGSHLNEFLRQGLHGDMTWLEGRSEQRASPVKLWPDVKSIIVLGVNHAPGHDPFAVLSDPRRGAIAVYAGRRDYHDVIKKRLKTLGRWIVETSGAEIKVFVDTAPVLEKPLAEQAGLGWQGKHTNLVSREFGSWLFLGSIFTTLELPADNGHADHCGGCARCLDICPTQAITGPYQLDARRCISYLTIEHKGHIDRGLRPGIGNRVFGCDDCLAICPWNKFAVASRDTALMPRAELTGPMLADLARLDDPSFRELFRGTPVKRLGRDRFIRNVLIAIANGGDTSHLERIEILLGDASPLVRAMAVWALSRLARDRRFAELKGRLEPRERDPEVKAEWSLG